LGHSLADIWHSIESQSRSLQAAHDELSGKVNEIFKVPTLTLSELRNSLPVPPSEAESTLSLIYPDGAISLASSLLSWVVGVLFEKWDIKSIVFESDSANPTIRPNHEQAQSALPNTPSMPLASFTIDELRSLCKEKGGPVSRDGIAISCNNDPRDLSGLVSLFLQKLLGEKANGSIQEIYELLGIGSLRQWFDRPASFFAGHLKQYSDNGRAAPIYWQICAGNGNFSIWLYYHRLTHDTLYRVLRDFVEPRIQQAEREQFELESQGALSGDAAVRLQEAQTLLQDLRILKSELDLVAPLWNPNLNDGVIINHAILWRITPYTPWQKKCKECWDKLVKGDYDWAHLAFHLWPERVIPKCTTDRSLAIAHGLEERLWQETNNGNWLARQLSEADLQALIAEHTKPAVKSALERFLAAPPPVAPTRTRASRSTRSTGSSAPRRPRGATAVVDAEATRQVLLALTAAPSDGLAKAAIADLVGVEANALTAVIKQLKDSGQIDQLGERRGARYVLSEQGRARLDQEDAT
jgi:hypothetical protein